MVDYKLKKSEGGWDGGVDRVERVLVIRIGVVKGFSKFC